MSVAQEIVDYLVAQGLCTASQITASRAPTVNLTENDQWVVYAAPGSKSGGNLVLWKRKHNIIIAYRNKSGELLYNKDDEVQNLLENCVSLPHYRVLRAVCNPMGELDTGSNEVHVGQWQATLDLVIKDEES